MLTLITTTRNRATCFSLLEHWVSHFTIPYDQWLVINDGDEPYTYTMGQEVHTRDPSNDTLPSICENWLAALPLIRGEKCLVLEDDDWYHPDYAERLCWALDRVPLAGFCQDCYWKLRDRKAYRPGNQWHASLAATGFTRAVLPKVERCCKVFRKVYIDNYLWAEWTCRETGGPWMLGQNVRPDGRAYHVGMKQMPGAAGLGSGHGAEGQDDPEGETLTRWVGADAASVYLTMSRSAEPGGPCNG